MSGNLMITPPMEVIGYNAPTTPGSLPTTFRLILALPLKNASTSGASRRVDAGLQGCRTPT